jgi:hypothetical protein
MSSVWRPGTPAFPARSLNGKYRQQNAEMPQKTVAQSTFYPFRKIRAISISQLGLRWDRWDASRGCLLVGCVCDAPSCKIGSGASQMHPTNRIRKKGGTDLRSRPFMDDMRFSLESNVTSRRHRTLRRGRTPLRDYRGLSRTKIGRTLQLRTRRPSRRRPSVGRAA